MPENSNGIQNEMTTFAGTVGKVEAYLAKLRDTTAKRLAVVVIHEIYGLNDHIKDVANRFASQGYVALAPHLFQDRISKGFSLQKILEPQWHS